MTEALAKLVSSIAKSCCEQVVERIVGHMKKQPSALSGDDSGLANAWEEFCVQVRAGESFFWEAYESMALALITMELEQLDLELQRAVWLQSDAGWDWLWVVEEADEAEGPGEAACPIPFITSESAQYVYASYLLQRAEKDPSRSVDAYLERDQAARAELDHDAGQVD